MLSTFWRHFNGQNVRIVIIKRFSHTFCVKFADKMAEKSTISCVDFSMLLPISHNKIGLESRISLFLLLFNR